MEKFARISEFEKLSKSEAKSFFGGKTAPTATSTTINCSISVSTANCTCNNNNPDSCSDVGEGTECVPDPVQ